MKTTTLFLSLVLSTGWLMSSCEENTSPLDESSITGEENLIGSIDTTDNSVITDSSTIIQGNLKSSELNDLLHLAEEEKLAHDVYNYAYQKHQINIFKNIAASEQSHINRVLEILNDHNEDDPTHPDDGVFYNESLQMLYKQLTSKVDLSLLDALKVGATIEDLDIKDIDLFLENTDNEALVEMYENLKCGSRNHMRAFHSLILKNNGTYSPQFISQEVFEEILNNDGEQCGI